MSTTKPAQRMTRRDFLKTGCAAGAAMGLAACGLTLAATQPNTQPDTDETQLPSFHYGETSMNRSILVAYASAFGSTAEAAVEIGKTLGENGCPVEVCPLSEMATLEGSDLSSRYQAIVIGSAVQYGHWLPEAIEFVKNNQQALSQVPVALFCVHITNVDDNPQSRANRLAFLDDVRPLVSAVDEAFFAGKFDRRGAAKLLPGWVARLVPSFSLMKKDHIRAWARGIQPQLAA